MIDLNNLGAGMKLIKQVIENNKNKKSLRLKQPQNLNKIQPKISKKPR